ncbi:hypothetical protein MBLNU457_6719t1 [Dothideomycetes sp. NU457]
MTIVVLPVLHVNGPTEWLDAVQAVECVKVRSAPKYQQLQYGSSQRRHTGRRYKAQSISSRPQSIINNPPRSTPVSQLSMEVSRRYMLLEAPRPLKPLNHKQHRCVTSGITVRLKSQLVQIFLRQVLDLAGPS